MGVSGSSARSFLAAAVLLASLPSVADLSPLDEKTVSAGATGASGMEALDDEEMAGVSGAGIALALENFRFSMSPSSYFEQVGTAPGTTAYERGDLRWYGLTMSGANAVGPLTHWNGDGCTSTTGLECPRGGQVQYFAPHDNPYVIRAFEYNGLDINGNSLDKTVLDVLAPTDQPEYRFGFWGELEVGKSGASNQALLKSQTLIQGNAAGSVLRLFQFEEESGVDTLGLFYHSELRGDFRFNLAQTGAGSNALGVTPRFRQDEGLHFLNVEAVLPLGQLHYQALTLDSTPAQDGNFVLELSRIPNNSTVYTEHYQRDGGDALGYQTALDAISGNLDVDSEYFRTHGYVRYGDFATTNGANSATDGIFFRAPAGQTIPGYSRTLNFLDMGGSGGPNRTGGDPNYSAANTGNNQVINLGDSRIEGLMVHHLRIESLGAN
jgi:hypothetical protein